MNEPEPAPGIRIPGDLDPMSIALNVPPPTDRQELDEAVARVRDSARAWAVLPAWQKIDLARSMLDGAARVSRRMVEAACAAKGIALDTPAEGEEWFQGPYLIVRMLRQIVRSLTLLARNGNTPVGRQGRSAEGRLTVRVFPESRLDALLFPGIRADVHLQEGVSETELHETRARFHKNPDHEGRVCLILGAGNVNAIPAADVITKLFNEGKACVLKTNPVNAYAGPLIEEAFAEAVRRGFLAVVYGGAEAGAYLAHHPAVDEVHITGSDRTHDLVVWGPPGPERAARLARNEPLLRKEITSELGCISPVLVVPGDWSGRRLRFHAENVAGMVTVNASFNCNAAKMLVTPKGWRHREAFLAAMEQVFEQVPVRRAWYPGAKDRYRALTEGREGLRRFGGGEGALPWTLVPGIDPSRLDEPAFRIEPFCSILSETSVGSEDPLEYLEAAVEFANERLWGTLSASILLPPGALRDPAIRAAVERAVDRLRYGTVVVNGWAAYGFCFGSTPWGAFPGSTLQDIQSGRGFVHNTLMLERVEKCVIRAPALPVPKPAYFPSHRTFHLLGRAATRLEATGALRGLPGITIDALRA